MPSSEVAPYSPQLLLLLSHFYEIIFGATPSFHLYLIVTPAGPRFVALPATLRDQSYAPPAGLRRQFTECFGKGAGHNVVEVTLEMSLYEGQIGYYSRSVTWTEDYCSRKA